MKLPVAFILYIAAFALADAQVPGTLSYQGILVNVAGNPVADGNHTVTFNFHKTATGGVPTFARGPFTVSTFKGLFTLVLGTGTPTAVNDPLPVLASDPNYIGNTQYYLELVADNVILSPRVSLSSMPYAFTAQNANSMNAAGLTGTVVDARLEPKVDITELTVGSSAQLAVSATGNITKINNVATSFPAAQGTANTLLSNDGSGNLSWVSPANSSGWSLTGNSGTTAGTNFIGTTDAKDLVFKSNNVERMRLTSSGNFGFGTNSPFAPFQVAGSLTVGSTGFASDVWVMQLLSTNIAPVSNRITFGTDNTGYKFAIAKNSGTITDLLTIQDNGNVGIGNTSPLGKLDVSNGPIVFGGTLNNTSTRPALTSAPINNEIWAYNSGLSTADDGFLRISAGGGTGAGSKSFIDISGFSTVADMNKNITFGTAGAEKMRIDVSGNVGIGTIAPASKLDVAGDVRLAQTTAPTTATDKLYNIGGSLYWNGAKLFNGFGNGNTFLGYDAGKANTTGGSNHFVGLNAGLDNTTGTENHFEGLSAGAANTTGSFNYFSGDGAGRSNTTANGNHFVGSYAGFSNTTGASNYFSGQSAGGNNTTASNNHFVGFHAGEFNTTGSNNYFNGYMAGNLNTTGSNNHFVGVGAGKANTTATENHFEGYRAGESNTTGAANLFIGADAGLVNTTANSNHFVGMYTGFNNTTGEKNYFSGQASGNSNTTASENHFQGYRSGYSNTTGTKNYFSGYDAGLANTTGSENYFSGYQAGKSNIAATANHFEGYQAGALNTTGDFNYFSGFQAGTATTTGFQNTATGFRAFFTNTIGQNNTAVGKQSLQSNTSGNFNVAVGSNALDVNTTGANNTALGTAAGSTVTTGSNLTLLGYNAQASSASATNEITFGNSSITSLRANVTSITSLSDRRDKKNISDLSLGLDFLMTLRPRQFNWDKREWYSAGHSDGSKMENNPTAGFISQELDQAQNSQHAEWLKLVMKNNPEKWEATYGNLLPVMVKAIQEQQQTIDSQKEKILQLEQKLEKLNGAFTAELDVIKKQLGMEVKAETSPSSTGGNK